MAVGQEGACQVPTRALAGKITHLSDVLGTAGNLLCQIEDAVDRLAGPVPSLDKVAAPPMALTVPGHLGDLQHQIECGQALNVRLSNLADRISNLL